MNYSEDSETSANAGDLGFTPESALRNTDPLTRELVTNLKPGQYSPIITIVNPMTKQLAGFRIGRVLFKEPAGHRELADPRVKTAIPSPRQPPRAPLPNAA